MEMEHGSERKRASRLPYVGALIAMGLVVVAAWMGRDRYQPIIAGAQAPDFQAVDLAGEPVGLDDFRGEVVLLNIWATWCAPCREEMPSMQRLYDAMDHPDFRVVAVSVDADAPGVLGYLGRPGGDVEGFANEFGLTFDILRDPSGRIGELYQTTGLPETFLIGRDGIIYRKVAGGTLWDAPQYQELVQRLLGS
jgi:cytochrome c biogenesis protein CcmG, thiol:disulfide interchange protein DsbE